LRARPTTTAACATWPTSSPACTGSSSTRRRRSSGESRSSSTSATATTTSRCCSRRSGARSTAAPDRRRARGALQRTHALRRAARAGGGSAHARRRTDRRAPLRGQGRGLRGAPAHRRTLARAARRRSAGARRARGAEPRVRGEVRFSLHRLREPPLARRARPGAARAVAGHEKRGARHGVARARRDRERQMLLGVDPYLIDWLDLSFRFLHVIAAIVWIGTSFYFVALDNHLRPAKERDDLTGESWEIHGGGFYRIERYKGTPPTIPEPLHRDKWEAYTTWLAGAALFVAL